MIHRGAVMASMVGLFVLLASVAGAKPPHALPLPESLEKARVDGKYAMLLRQIEVRTDADECGPFRDGGQRAARPEYHGHKDLPAGFWVYVYPYWYIWRDETAKPQPARGWGPEQATGPPNTTGPGDIQTAWASLTPDGQDEWLMLEYAEPAVPSAVLVHETYNPGALCRVTAFKLDGEEVELWKGKDPTAPSAGAGVSEVAVAATFKTNRVKLYIDSKAVPGWNEIDAVGLRDSAGKTHWATAADASSTYAEQGAGIPPAPVVIIGPAPPIAVPPLLAPPAPPVVNPPPAILPPPAPANAKDKRIQQLKEEIQDLKERLKSAEDRLKKEDG